MSPVPGRRVALQPFRHDMRLGAEEQRQHRQLGRVDLLHVGPDRLALRRIELAARLRDVGVHLRIAEGDVVGAAPIVRLGRDLGPSRACARGSRSAALVQAYIARPWYLRCFTVSPKKVRAGSFLIVVSTQAAFHMLCSTCSVSSRSRLPAVVLISKREPLALVVAADAVRTRASSRPPRAAPSPWRGHSGYCGAPSS